MTILDYDLLADPCPRCGRDVLVFVTDSDARQVGHSIQNRCKECAVEEARAAGELVTVKTTIESKPLVRAWKTGEVSPYHRYGVACSGSMSVEGIRAGRKRVARWKANRSCGAETALEIALEAGR